MEEPQQNPAATERRANKRYPADEPATIHLVRQNSSQPCHIVELSLGGCRLLVNAARGVDGETPIEVSFRIHRIALRLGGFTRWTDGRQTVGIRFGGMSSRRLDDLTEVIAELEAEQVHTAAEVELLKGFKPTASARPEVSPSPNSIAAAPASNSPHTLPVASIERERLKLQSTGGGLQSRVPGEASKSSILVTAPSLSRANATQSASSVPVPALPVPPLPGTASKPLATENPVPSLTPSPHKTNRERRVEARHCVDTRATIFFIDVAAKEVGRILDVSMTGCRIRTDERFPSGIYRRVETEFKIDGLPFRLSAVVQSLHDRHTVGIRFLNVSDRKREQLRELMQEIDDMRQSGRFPEPGAQTPDAAP